VICAARSRIEIQRDGTRAYAILDVRFYEDELTPTTESKESQPKTKPRLVRSMPRPCSRRRSLSSSSTSRRQNKSVWQFRTACLSGRIK